MKLFEAYFRDSEKPWILYERYNENGMSSISQINLNKEVFIEDNNGDHTFLFDNNIKLKKIKKPKNVDNIKTYGDCDIGLEWIRQKYWSTDGARYNLNPEIFFLDIETTATNKINTDLCNETIVSIQIYIKSINVNFILCMEDFDTEKYTINEYYNFDKKYDFKLKFLKCNDERELLNSMFKIISHFKPLLVLAHNGSGFDFAYLWRRTQKLGLIEAFSPFGKSKFKENILDNGTKYYNIEAPGVFYMDSIDIYKKFTFAPRDSYGLDNLAKVELGESKVNHDCYNTFDGFRTGEGYIRPSEEPPKESILEYKLYHATNEDEVKKISKEWFIHYSIIDTYLLYKIMEKRKLIDIMISLSSKMGININKSLGTTSPWGNYIRNYALSMKKVLPNFDDSEKDRELKGGYVKEPQIGKHEWIFSVDVTSMYPSQIMAFNMSPETYIDRSQLPVELVDEINNLKLSEDEQYHLSEYIKNPDKYKKYTDLLNKYNLCGTLSGAVFHKNETGIVPVLVEKIFTDRKMHKKKMLKYESMIEKINAELSKRD